MSRPNVLLIVIDSLRADAVFGDDPPTPNLDELARRGAAFVQCISTSTTTTPSFSSLLTACYPPKHGVRGLQGYRLSESVKTMSEAFGSAGYHTCAEVTGPLVPETGVLRGFDEVHHRPGYRTAFFGWRDDVMARMRARGEPWFTLLHVWEVHRPFRPPPTFAKRYDRAGYEAVVTATDEALAPLVREAGDAIVVVTGDHGEAYARSRWERLALRATRKLRKTLKPSKWLPSLDDKLAGTTVGHGFALYEHLVRVPLVITGPRVSPVVVDEQVRHVDLFPTLAELSGLEAPPGIDGRSLRPLMEGRALPEEPAYMEAVGVKLEGKRIIGVRTPDWKLLRRGDGKPALHRLNGGAVADEKRNLYGRFPEVESRLEAFLEQVAGSEAAADSGMTTEEEAVVEQHLRDLGYL